MWSSPSGGLLLPPLPSALSYPESLSGWDAELWRRRDPRLDGWLLMDSPWPTVVACVAYVYFVKVCRCSNSSDHSRQTGRQ